MEDDPDEYDQYDARWLQLYKQLEKTKVTTHRSSGTIWINFLSEKFPNSVMYIYFYCSQKPSYEIYLNGVRTSFETFFELLSKEHKEVFVFYLDLFEAKK